MFSNLLHVRSGRSVSAPSTQEFVQEIAVADRETRNPRVERLILVCWLLIALKHVAVIWAVAHYPVPFHALWVNFPTWLLGVLATGIYFWRGRR